MTTSELIVSYSGIRGIFGVTLTAEVAARYANAFGKMIAARHGAAPSPMPTILVGRDTRTSGPVLVAGAMRALSRFGTVVDLGVVATPTLQHALGVFDASAALCITASHNPAQWNGMKLFLAPERIVLDAAQVRELRTLVAAPFTDSGGSPSTVAEVRDRHEEAVRVHVERVCAHVDVERIRAARFRVAVDSGGGAGEEVTLRLLEALGCEAVPVHCARESEPLVEHLSELRRVVVEERCDLGVAQDLDADRLALVAENGHAPGEELTLVLAVDHLLARSDPARQRVVVKNVSTSRALDEIVQRHGARLVETAVGEVNLSRAFASERAAGNVVFGGEGNGGVIFPELHLGRDSVIGIGLVLERLATTPRRPLSAHLTAMPRYVASKRKVTLGSAPDALEALLARVEAEFASTPGADVSRLDGLRVRFADGSWVGVRPSNTEPIVRIVAESKSQQWVNDSIARLERIG
jgi:phosphomannomutase